MKTKQIGIILLMSLCAWSNSANSQNFNWAKRLGGNSSDYGYSITTDAMGNVYTTGVFFGSGDFDPGTAAYNLISAGNFDVFVSKLDASGNFVWAKRMGGTSQDVGYSIAVDINGDVYIAGYFAGTADFDPDTGIYNLTSTGGAEIFVSKLDAAGNLVWAKQMGGINDDSALSIDIDMNGNVYTTGSFRDTADFDPGAGIYNLVSPISFGVFVSKLNSSGNFLWAKQAEGNGFGHSITVDNNGNVYTTGRFVDTVDFDPGPGIFNLVCNGGEDIFISKLDVAGNFIWAKNFGGIYNDMSRGIAVDINGNVYSTGYFMDISDFDPGPGIYNLTSFGTEDIFVSKLDASGNFLWAKQLGGSAGDMALSIAVDVSGNVFTTGEFFGTADFNPGTGTYNLTSFGSFDIFISKLDGLGNFIWAKQMGSATTLNGDVGFSITLDIYGNIYTTGIFNTTADFDPGVGIYNLTVAGAWDAFVVKLGNATGIVENSNSFNAINISPNPATNQFTIHNSQFTISTIEIYNVLGEKVFSQKPTTGNRQQITVDVSNWNKGIYFVKMSDGEKQYAQKVIIQ